MLKRRCFFSGSQDFFHSLATCQFINQFIQIANLLHEGFFDVLNAMTADESCDFGDIGV